MSKLSEGFHLTPMFQDVSMQYGVSSRQNFKMAEILKSMVLPLFACYFLEKNGNSMQRRSH